MELEATENVWYATRYNSLPIAAAEQLRLASLAYEHDVKAEMHLALARAIAPKNPVVKVGEYRYYFYKNRLEEALIVARECLLLISQELSLPNDWKNVLPSSASFTSDEPALIFYLFCLKAYAYLLLRQDYLEEGREAAEKLMTLDPKNKIGGQVLIDVLERAGKDDYDE